MSNEQVWYALFRNDSGETPTGREIKHMVVAWLDKNNLDEIKSLLSEHNCTFSELGIFTGDQITFKSNSELILELRVDKAENNYLNSLGKIIQNG